MIWNGQRCCGHCGSLRTRDASHAKMPYWCSDCRSYFSVRTGSALESSRLPLRKWAIAIYLEVTSLKSVSSMKLHRDIGVSQRAAWFMLHRIRQAWTGPDDRFDGPVEADETYVGGKRKNMPKAKRAKLTGRGTAGKTAVAGVKDRATNRVSAAVVKATDSKTLQGFVSDRAAPNATVYTDDAPAYAGLPFDHHTVKHSVGEYVDGMAHTNGIESFWSMLKRAHKGTFHKDQPQASEPLRAGIRREAQRPQPRHHRADGGVDCRAGRQEASLPRSHCRQRTGLGSTTVMKTLTDDEMREKIKGVQRLDELNLYQSDTFSTELAVEIRCLENHHPYTFWISRHRLVARLKEILRDLEPTVEEELLLALNRIESLLEKQNQ